MGTPAFSWNDCDVKTLIKKRIELHSMFTGKRGSALAGWQLIAELLGNGATHQQCKKKWENLLQRYRDIVSPLSAKDGLVSVRWQFFEDLHPFVSMHQYVNSPLVGKPDQEQEQGIVTVHMPRSLLKCAPTSPNMPVQETFANGLSAANASLPAAAKKCKVEPKKRSLFEEGEVGYETDSEDGSIHSFVETDEVPVIVEISEPARRVSQASECRCAACPLGSLKRARVSEMCDNISSSLPQGSSQPEARKIFNREQHRQVMDTLQMEHRIRKHVLQAELEMTKRILQVELDIRQEELDFRRTFHRLQLKKLAQNLSSNS